MNESSLTVQIETAEVFEPLLDPARYKGAHGGRGSGKSHFFAESAVETSLMKPGTRGVCVREVQKTLRESALQLIADKIERMKAPGFRVLNDRIVTPGDGVILFQGMQDHTAESIKSLEGMDFAWVEEAQTLSQRSLELLRPTIREEGSELWFSWNPRNATDPVDRLLRGETLPPRSIVVQANYSDNPWLPKELEEERAYDQVNNPDRYAHIWLGDYEPTAIGAIWNRQKIQDGRRAEAPEMSRILVSVDPAITNEGGDEHGIIVGGLGADQRGYVLDDMSCHGSPRQWADRAVAAYDRYEADAIVVERNQGGDMVKHTLQSVRPGLRVIEVVATRGKHVRAEPISALYDLERISHVGTFPQLEDQMVKMTAAGYEGDGSPDRVDSLVWLMTELFPRMTKKKTRTINVQRPGGEGSWMA